MQVLHADVTKQNARRVGTYAVVLGPREHEYEQAHVLTNPEYGVDLEDGVRVRIGDKRLTLGHGIIVTSDLPLRMCLPVVGRSLGVLEVGHYLVNTIQLALRKENKDFQCKAKEGARF